MTTEKDLRASLSMTTVSGRVVSILDPRAEDIDLGDIAHALSMICRYGGHMRHHWSVAAHSIACVREARIRGLPIETQRVCLMHDAAEAYVGDIIWPVKRALYVGDSIWPVKWELRVDGRSPFEIVEREFQWVITKRFGVDVYAENEDVKAIDQAVCAREMLDLRAMPVGWTPHVEPATVNILAMSQSRHIGRRAFLDLAAEIGIEVQQ